MKDFMKKNILALCCLAVALSCCMTAALGYYLTASQQDKKLVEEEKYKEYSWLMALTDRYAYLHSDKYGKTLRGEDEDYRFDYTLSVKGEVLKEQPASKEIHDGRFYTDSIGDGLYLYFADSSSNNNQGAVDGDGNIVIPPEFIHIYYFQDGYACACNSRNENVIIDAKGNTVYNTKKGPNSLKNDFKARPLNHISDTRYLVCEDKPFVLNAKTGEKTEIDSRILKRLTYISPLEKGGFIAYLSASDLDNNKKSYENNWAFCVILDENFQVKSDALYRYIGSLSAGGLRYAERSKMSLGEFLNQDEFKTYTEENKQKKFLPTEKGYMNKDEKMVLAVPEETVFAFPFSEKKAVVYTRDKAVIMNPKGEILFELEADITVSGDSTFASAYSEYEMADSVFRGGFASIQKRDGCFGVINADGKWVIKPEFEGIEAAADGVYIVEAGGKYGIISLEGGKKNAQ